MTADPTQSQPRGTTKRARAVVRRRARNEQGSVARQPPRQGAEWSVPSLGASHPSTLLRPPASGGGDGAMAPGHLPVREDGAHRGGAGEDRGAQGEHGPSRRRARKLRWPARRRRVERLQRARRQVMAGIVVLVAMGGVLTGLGLREVRGSTAGRYINPALQPDDPGYAAFVTPTPTMLVLSEGDDGELTGVALLALQAEDDGGSVVIIPTATQASFGRQIVTLAQGFTDGGSEGVTNLVEGLLKLAVGDTVEVDDRRWATLVDPVGGISLSLDAAVGRWEAGDVTLDPTDVGPFLAARTEDESELNRATRQEDFWRAWLEEVAGAGDGAVAGEQDSGLGRFVRGLAAGADVDSLPVVTATGSTDEFSLDAALAADELARSVPFPQSPAPGIRPRVRLLNGTEDPELTAHAAEALVKAGAEITISGNAASFDEQTTRILYSDDSSRAAATWIGEFLGIGEVERDSSGQDAAVVDESEQIDLTVILGADAPEAIRR